jgi:hypothetical protein
LAQGVRDNYERWGMVNANAPPATAALARAVPKSAESLAEAAIP